MRVQIQIKNPRGGHVPSIALVWSGFPAHGAPVKPLLCNPRKTSAREIEKGETIEGI